MKKILFFTLMLVLVGAGCAGVEQATIDSPMLGSADAPIEIIEYFDYQCGACKKAHKNTIPFIIEDYVNTGKANFTFKNMAFLGPDSRTAANAALCAHEQGKFLEYHDKIFENQADGEESDFNKKKLVRLGEGLEMDMAQFETCVNGGKYRVQVSDEMNEAKGRGVTGAPTFFINGEKMIGGSFMSLKRMIDEKLEE
ncbi:DsbA family protein [Patescibacteria group bacterium]